MDTSSIDMEIIFEGIDNHTLSGRKILQIPKQNNLNILSQQEVLELFETNSPVLERFKVYNLLRRPVFIFCNEMFPTPHSDVASGDKSVWYFCWIETFNSWYKCHWRVEDTWNVTVAILVNRTSR